MIIVLSPTVKHKTMPEPKVTKLQSQFCNNGSMPCNNTENMSWRSSHQINFACIQTSQYRRIYSGNKSQQIDIYRGTKGTGTEVPNTEMYTCKTQREGNHASDM